jgi:hypothetical protein
MKRQSQKFVLALDYKNGFFVAAGNRNRNNIDRPVINIGQFDEVKKQSDLLNYQFELF